jgi:large-conductance mechanosensitive channel
MFGFLFRTTTYYLLWKKFSKQIILIGLSILFLLLVEKIYDDLFELLKVSSKESLIGLFISKWLVFLLVITYNIYRLKKTQLTKEEKEEIFDSKEPEYSKEIQELLEKKKLTSTTDILIKKYKK